MEEETQKFDFKKATTIQPKISKVRCKTSPETLHKFFNECLTTGSSPDNLELANITPVFKKKDPLNKENLVFLKFLKKLCKNK